MGNLEFFTGFEGCEVTADITTFFDYRAGDSAYSATGGYDNGKCLHHVYGSGLVTKNVSAAKTKCTGFHASGFGKRDVWLIGLHTQVLHFAGPVIRVWNTTTGLLVQRGSTDIASAPGVWSPATLGHLEVKLFSDATAGTFQLKWNGELLIDASGINTGGQDITSISYGTANINNVYLDNMFIADDWMGELKSQLLKPSSDVTVAMTPSAGTDNYAMVDDAAQDGDTTYVSGSGSGTKDILGYEDVPSGYTVAGVSVVTVAKKDDVGDVTLNVLAVQDTTEYEVDSKALGTAYPAGAGAAFIKTLPLAPDGTAWTREKLNAINWGYGID